MKQAFLASIKLMYPNGLDVLTEGHQWRDLIRIYSMGWCDALMATGDKQGVEKFINEFRDIAAEKWMPDNSWKWW